jgi:hypothetical protein
MVSEDLLLVVVVVSLWRWQEGEMVAAVRYCGAENSHNIPDPNNTNM